MEKGLKGDTLAKGLKNTKAAISLMENGLIDFKISKLGKIADILGVSLSQLICSTTFHTLKQLQKTSDPEDYILMNSAVIRRLISKIERLNALVEKLNLVK